MLFEQENQSILFYALPQIIRCLLVRVSAQMLPVRVLEEYIPIKLVLSRPVIMILSRLTPGHIFPLSRGSTSCRSCSQSRFSEPLFPFSAGRRGILGSGFLFFRLSWCDEVPDETSDLVIPAVETEAVQRLKPRDPGSIIVQEIQFK